MLELVHMAYYLFQRQRLNHAYLVMEYLCMKNFQFILKDGQQILSRKLKRNKLVHEYYVNNIFWNERNVYMN
ncbi:hypothetical protein KSF78_0009462 [Schistosoma japonicum]|nr:hypothetical protein KSF78_0009462 [Schistosoma japonicum]